jgi:hypothetical protein
MLPVGVKAEGEDKENLRKRLKFLKDAVREAIHESNPEIKISRWEPGHVRSVRVFVTQSSVLLYLLWLA